MNLDLLQIINGAATFAERGRSAKTANDGALISIPAAQWVAIGSPTALAVELHNAEHSGTAPGTHSGEAEASSEPESAHRYGYPAGGGSYL